MTINQERPGLRAFKSLSGPELSTAMESREAEVETLHDMIARTEGKLKASKDTYEPLRQNRDSLDREVDQLFKKFNTTARNHNILRSVRKITPLIGVSGIPVGLILGLAVSPLAMAVGSLLSLGSAVLHQFSQRHCEVMTRECEQIKADYNSAAANLARVKAQCTTMEQEFQQIDRECKMLKEKETKAAAEVKAMAGRLMSCEPSGASDVDEAHGYIIIDGFKIKKQAAE
jgi:septal ring factor EnvC (AmiA/AmiB activator)